GMQERAIASQKAMQGQMDAYVRSAAGTGSTADELSKLADLKAKGTITDAEYESLKAKAIG
ncbi:MAG: SHOCT domain-containing protein, partial [Thermoleophilaceae bacterium]|nr:SHOCT domain-containing protein [Thermoleophilaceae bacterium]